jgi:hypothetical protein
MSHRDAPPPPEPPRVPAAWYPDPEQQGQQRYWDGQAWTEHVAPLTTATPAADTTTRTTTPPAGAYVPNAGQQKQAWIVAGGIGAVILIGALIGQASHRDGGTDASGSAAGATPTMIQSPTSSTVPSSSAGTPVWVAKVSDWRVLNPASLRVWITVRNTGTAAGTPSCTVSVRDSSYTYSGWDVWSYRKPIQPRHMTYGSGPITVTNQGAAYVTQAKVKCKNK